jgi:hypothetical protein
LHLVVFVYIDAIRVLRSGFGFIIRHSANRITGEYRVPPQPPPIRFRRTFLRLLAVAISGMSAFRPENC